MEPLFRINEGLQNAAFSTGNFGTFLPILLFLAVLARAFSWLPPRANATSCYRFWPIAHKTRYLLDKAETDTGFRSNVTSRLTGLDACRRKRARAPRSSPTKPPYTSQPAVTPCRPRARDSSLSQSRLFSTRRSPAIHWLNEKFVSISRYSNKCQRQTCGAQAPRAGRRGSKTRTPLRREGLFLRAARRTRSLGGYT